MIGDTVLLVAPVVVPILAAGAAFLLGPWPAAQRVFGIAVLTGVAADAAVLLARVDARGVLVVRAGGYPPPLGITLVADRLSALILLVSAVVLLAVLVFAIGQGMAERRAENVPSVFHPSYLVLSAGIALAFLTGDLFTLYVGIEVMLMASYVLITLGATRERVRSGTTYVATSLTASLLLLIAIGFVYGVTGTVNLADLGRQIPLLPEGLRAMLGLMLLIALGVKAAVVPLHGWLPDSYPTAPAPVTAVFAALLTKVGVYAIVRTQTLLFPRQEPWAPLLALAAIGMVVGILGALAQDDVNRVLSFALVSHIGFMLLGLGLSSVAGTTGTILYLVHHITVLAGLFLVTGIVERERGTTSLSRLGGLAATAPMLSLLFLITALSISGVPPFSGFIGKLALFEAAVRAGGVLALTLAAVAVAASLLTLAAMARIGLRAFWREPVPPVPEEEREGVPVPGSSAARLMEGSAVAVVAIGVVIALAAGPLTAIARRAADDLLARRPYQDAVLDHWPPGAAPSGRGPSPGGGS